MMMNPDFTSSATITLSDFIRREQTRFAGASGTLSNILFSIALGTKIVSHGVNMGGLASLLGLTGKQNVQGENVQKLDEFADQVFRSVLGRSGEFISMVSEEQEHVIPAKKGSAESKYVIAFDPLDGSSNIDVNVSIGTIWGIYRRCSEGAACQPADIQDFTQQGTKQVAAGYTIYGSSTMFVFTTGEGVHGFTLDPGLGEFILTHRNMQIPRFGNIYSCNEGNVSRWSEGVKAYLDYVKTPKENGEEGYPFAQRYVGSLVADFHRTVLKGGIFFYPADTKNKSGKLRLLYECAPLAYIAEHAGGKASDGKTPILSKVASAIHERSPLFIGSVENVEQVEEFIAKHG